VAKRATVVWINQTRQVVGGYSPAGQGPRYATMGGRALPFFGSIRLDLSVIEKLKDSKEDVYAMKVKVYTQKNKVSPQYKSAVLTYVMGEGFSVIYDYFDVALKMKVIDKKGSWYIFGDHKIQGDLSFYHKMKEDPEFFEEIKQAIEKELVDAEATTA
jgi:recombination protein RecA